MVEPQFSKLMMRVRFSLPAGDVEMKNILYLIHHFDDKKILRDTREGIVSFDESADDSRIDAFVKELMREDHFENDDDTFFWKTLSDEEIERYREENPEVPVIIFRGDFC